MFYNINFIFCLSTTRYMKYLYPYECEKKNLSTPAELQAAIDGNRREGRRSSYGQFDSQMQGQLQMVCNKKSILFRQEHFSKLVFFSTAITGRHATNVTTFVGHTQCQRSKCQSSSDGHALVGTHGQRLAQRLQRTNAGIFENHSQQSKGNET